MSMWEEPVEYEQPEGFVSLSSFQDEALFEGDSIVDAPAGFHEAVMERSAESEAMLHDVPEGALPTAEGEVYDTDASIVGPAIAEQMVRQGSRDWIMGGGVPGEGNGDIAGAAREFLKTGSKMAAKVFSPAEQQQIIDEPRSGARAANLDRLDLTGTHYPTPGEETLDDDQFLWM